MFYIKFKNLLKINNCYFCHFSNYYEKKIFFKNIPKIKYQYFDYLFWSLKQYQVNFKKSFFYRKNFLMKSQIQNISHTDLKYISLLISVFNLI